MKMKVNRGCSIILSISFWTHLLCAPISVFASCADSPFLESPFTASFSIEANKALHSPLLDSFESLRKNAFKIRANYDVKGNENLE